MNTEISLLEVRKRGQYWSRLASDHSTVRSVSFHREIMENVSYYRTIILMRKKK